jgi:hypothetical protein
MASFIEKIYFYLHNLIKTPPSMDEIRRKLREYDSSRNMEMEGMAGHSAARHPCLVTIPGKGVTCELTDERSCKFMDDELRKRGAGFTLYDRTGRECP